MKANRKKIDIILAKSCMTIKELQKKSDMPMPTLKNAYAGKNVKPATAGKLANALGVDVTEIIE